MNAAVAEMQDGNQTAGDKQPLVQISQTVVEDSQRTLARLSVAQRAYELLKSQARALNVPVCVMSTCLWAIRVIRRRTRQVASWRSLMTRPTGRSTCTARVDAIALAR